MNREQTIRLGIITFCEVQQKHIDMIDNTCLNVWKNMPLNIKFHDIKNQIQKNDLVEQWSRVYFGSKFIPYENQRRKSGSYTNGSPRKDSGSPHMERKNSSPRLISILTSPRTSPRISLSPRKFTQHTRLVLDDMFEDRTHIFIIGYDENKNDVEKAFSDKEIITMN